MFSAIWNKIKEIVRKMLPKKTVEEVLRVTPCMSDRMADAIQLWSDMYEGNSPWLKNPTYEDPTRIVSLGLPALIASEKARMVTLEMKTEISAPVETVNSTNPSNKVGEATPTSGESGKQNPTLTDAPTENTIAGGIGSNNAFAQTTKEVPIGPTERADFLGSQYKKLIRQVRRQLEYGIAKGGIVIKPYIVSYAKKNSDNNTQTAQNTQNNTSGDETKQTLINNTATKEQNAQSKSGKLSYDANLPNYEIEFDFVQADRFFPLSFDANGKVVEAAFVQTKVDKARERVYIRLEYHKLEGRTVTVQNYAFESTDMNLANSNNIKSATHLGNPISLKMVPEWASLAPSVVIEDVDRLLFAYFKMPEANTIDPYSPLGVSGYSRVIQLIKDADMQYSRMLWEFEAGEMAIDVDRDALKFVTDPNGEGHTVLPEKQNRLFRKVDLNKEDTYEVFSPTLRDESLTRGLNTILTHIEDNCGLSRGTLSEITSVEAKTATELKILKQRSFATNADIQYALQDALEDAVYVMDVYCTLYDVTPAGKYEVSFEWDDSIIVDSESELTKRLTLMQNGLASKVETRMWYFGETENQAKAALAKVDEESTQAMLQNIQAEKMKAGIAGNVGNASSDKTNSNEGSGKQADSLDNPDKSKIVDQIKG